MSPTIALICLWLATQPQTVYPVADTTYDIGGPPSLPVWARTGEGTGMLGGIQIAVPEKGKAWVCPKHGNLDKGSYIAALALFGKDEKRTRPVCFFCVLEAAQATDSCLPVLE